MPIIGIGLYPKLMTDSYRSSSTLVSRDGGMERITQPTAPAAQCIHPAVLQAPLFPSADA